MSQRGAEDGAAVAAFFDQNEDFWKNYIRGRPRIPQSLFDRIFQYHDEHGGSYKRAHDVGAAIGMYSEVLGTKFARVLVSDASEENIKIASTRLSHKYDFEVMKMEDGIDLEKCSVDLVFASTMMHMVDHDKAMEAVRHQLKSGGTLAVAFTGPAHLLEQPQQDIWRRLFNALLEGVVGSTGGVHGVLHEVVRNQTSGLDFVGLEGFEDVVRYDLNLPSKDFFRWIALSETMDREYEPLSRVGPGDKIVSIQDSKGWTFRKDIHGMKEFLDSIPTEKDIPLIQSIWTELVDCLGDEEVDGIWPASLILARKT